MDKICHVNLVRIRATNPRLLRIDGVPCKIYLDCFSPHEFVKLTNLITTYGGVVLPPDDETVVLVKDAKSESKHHPRFSVKWLHDTVSKNELQDVGKYLIPVALDAVPSRAIKYFPIIHGLTASFASVSAKVSSPQPSTSAADGKSTSRATPKKKPAPKRRSTPIPQKSTAEDERQGADESVPNEADGEGPVVTAEKRRVSKAKVHERKREHPNIDAEHAPKEKKRRSQKKQRSMSLGDEFGDRTANPESCESEGGVGGSDGDSVAFLSEMPTSSRPRWSEADVRKEKRRRSRLERKKSISCLEELKDRSGPDERQRARGGSTKKYSDAENRKIMQFLVDKKKISQAYRHKTWEELEAEQILQDPPRSASGMLQHFNRNFINNYKKYTEDPAVIAEFEKLERRKLKNIVNYFNIGHSSEEDA